MGVHGRWGDRSAVVAGAGCIGRAQGEWQEQERRPTAASWAGHVFVSASPSTRNGATRARPFNVLGRKDRVQELTVITQRCVL